MDINVKLKNVCAKTAGLDYNRFLLESTTDVVMKSPRHGGKSPEHGGKYHMVTAKSKVCILVTAGYVNQVYTQRTTNCTTNTVVLNNKKHYKIYVCCLIKVIILYIHTYIYIIYIYIYIYIIILYNIIR